jgi:flagellar M-ring protein FliF
MVEASYQERVLALLEPVVGRDNVRASVTADLDFSQVMRTAEAFRPNQGADAQAAVREQRTEESSEPGAATAGGVPGAQSNQPPTPAAAPINGPAQALQGAPGGAAGAAARREAATRFELDKTVTVTRQAAGTVRRLSAAVVVNHRTSTDAKGKEQTAPLSEQEIEQLTALVQQGIGFDAQRGDAVRVVNAPFRETAVPEPAALPLWQQPWAHDLARSGAAPAALALVGLAAVFVLLRPALKAMLAPPPAPAQRVDAVVDDTPALPSPDETLALENATLNQKLQAARAMARENPAAVASIARGWMAGEKA